MEDLDLIEALPNNSTIENNTPNINESTNTNNSSNTSDEDRFFQGFIMGFAISSCISTALAFFLFCKAPGTAKTSDYSEENV